MSKTYIKSGYSKKSKHDFNKPRSKRAHVFENEESSRLRRKVLFYLGVVIILYLVYFLFYSNHFKIDNFIISNRFNRITLYFIVKLNSVTFFC